MNSGGFTREIERSMQSLSELCGDNDQLKTIGETEEAGIITFGEGYLVVHIRWWRATGNLLYTQSGQLPCPLNRTLGRH